MKLVIADDEAMVRGGLRMLIESEPDLEVVGEAADGHEAVEITRRVRPDLVLMDIRMPRMDGLTAARRVIEAFSRQPASRPPPPELAELTPRELEVLRLVARGLSNAEIARELVVSEATVKTHVNRLLMKLSVRDRTQAVVLAYEAGVVRPGES